MQAPKQSNLEKMQSTEGSIHKSILDAQQSYRFEMKIYIDDVEVSYLKVKTSDNSYYLYFVEERNGINDWKNSDLGFIEFVYQ